MAGRAGEEGMVRAPSSGVEWCVREEGTDCRGEGSCLRVVRFKRIAECCGVLAVGGRMHSLRADAQLEGEAE